ncbi:WG repeat-containing protein [Terrihabitans soli]|nr:WG repeat-containing protein [Terrihabitans soli]
MHLRLFLSLVALIPAAAASAQQACTPSSTPVIGADDPAPALFSHCVEETKCGAVDRKGEWKVPPKFRDVLIKDDFIVVPENDDWTKYGFLGANGESLGSGEYTISVEEDLPVSEGLLPVVSGEKAGYVDKTGKLRVPAEFDYGAAFVDGLAAVEQDGKHFYIDTAGKTVVAPPPGFDDLSAFVDGVAVVGKEGKYGLIDKTGKLVVEPNFDSIYADSGVLVALKEASYGILDKTGNWIAKPDFAAIGPFSDGLAPAQQGERWGFIDTCGNWKIPAKYTFAIGFDGGPARVQIDEKWGLIDKTGKEITPVDKKFIGDGIWRDGLITFSPDETKYGLIDTTGKTVIEPKYDSVDPLGGGVLMAYDGEEMKLLNLDGSEIKVLPAP